MNRHTRILGPGVLLLVALIAVVAGLIAGGAAAPAEISDPGPVVRYGLPIAKLLVNLSAALMIGSLLLAVFVLTPEREEYDAAVDLAATGAGVFTVASGATALFTFLNVTGVVPSLDDQFGAQIGLFFTGVELGVSWLYTVVFGAVLTVACFAIRGQRLRLVVTALSMVALYPMASQGHAAGNAGHGIAVTSLYLHLVFAAVWLGGLLAIVLIRRTIEPGRVAVVLARYSSVALVCFVVVAVSGYFGAALRIGSIGDIASGYGLLVVVKVAALIALGLFGAAFRRRTIAGLGRDYRANAARFWTLVVAELGFMGLASGVAAALARTATPVVETTDVDGLTPAEILTDDVLPPELTPMSFLTGWDPDVLWLIAAGFGIFFYLAGVRRLRARGDRWPVYRTVCWVLGLLVLAWLTSGGFNLYQDYLFSVHMLGHMGLTMVVPLLLVPGAPVTLASRAIVKRTDGSRGGREWILWAVHTPFASIVSHPVVAAVLFAGSLWVFYYTGLFRWSMDEHLGHEWMVVHFVITGYLFTQSLIGIDPVKYRLPYAFRLILLLATMAFHAFFGLAIMQASGLFLADWFGAMGRTWGATPLDDQQNGGGIAWGIGEIPTVLMAVIVAIQWSRSDDREQRRLDRNADRTGDAELKEYNRRLEQLAERDRG
ncbi:cytochrome c oxidase assembly protein [Mycetocola reblochoni]|uniref:Copper resistance protein D n=1 Tax=Mycetocola reblochoni REB411 TaxID=1255698 RepID=A0A1R4KCW1_9MICO|nr:cytochrome c oxidase assembly protein [Mycetocola reblochoni]SJN41843.1 Copper resistance protein D [Mycetocola reblochoni REB411]